MNIFSIEALNERAAAFGCTVVEEEEPVGHWADLGVGPWCRVERDGERVFGVSYRGEEVDIWLRLREKETA